MALRKALTIPLSDIDVSDRLLPLDEAKAQEIAASIESRDLVFQPVGLRPTPRAARPWKLVFGRHRMRAFEIVGIAELIEGVHFKRLAVDAADALRVEIEENMARKDHTPFARAVMLAAYRVDTGIDGRGAHNTEEIKLRKLAGFDQLVVSFTAHAMQVFDLSSDQVERLLRIGKALTKPAGLAERLHFSKIARNQSQLLKLAALPEEQLARAAEAFDAAKGDFFGLMAILAKSPADQAKALGKIKAGATLDDVVEAKPEQSAAFDFWGQAVSSYSQLDHKGRITATIEHFKQDEKAVREALKSLGFDLVKVAP